MLDGAFHVSFTSPEPTPSAGATCAVTVGAAGGPAGVATTVAHDPVPTMFLAATRNEYGVPLVSPLILNVSAVDTPSSTTVHVAPSVDRSMT